METTKSGANLSNSGGEMMARDLSPQVDGMSSQKPEERMSNLSFVQSQQYSMARGKSAKHK
jgi:hypothetical protein